MERISEIEERLPATKGDIKKAVELIISEMNKRHADLASRIDKYYGGLASRIDSGVTKLQGDIERARKSVIDSLVSSEARIKDHVTVQKDTIVGVVNSNTSAVLSEERKTQNLLTTSLSGTESRLSSKLDALEKKLDEVLALVRAIRAL